jgi:hypothetical protein
LDIHKKLKAAGLSDDQGLAVREALAIYSFIYNDDQAEIGTANSRLIDVSARLHRGPGGFHKWTRGRLEASLVRLEKRGVVTAATTVKGAGRPKQHRYISLEWSREGGRPYDELAEALADFLIEGIDTDVPDHQGIAPTTVAPKAPAPIAPATVTQTAPHHQVTAPISTAAAAVTAPPAVSDPEAVRVLIDCRLVLTALGSGPQTFMAGQIISDPAMIKALKNNGSPVADVNDLTTTCCAVCLAVFDTADILTVGGLLPPLIVLADFQISFNGSMISRKRGDIISDFGLSKYLLEESVDQVSVAAPTEASRCPDGHIFAVPAIRGNRAATLIFRQRLAASAQARRHAEAERRAEQERANEVIRGKLAAEAASKVIPVSAHY